MGFRYAFDGVRIVLGERNMRCHVAVAVAVVVAGVWFRITAVEWCLCVLCIGEVMALEAVNTSIERVCDHVSPERNGDIKVVKDVAAGAVLIGAVGAAVVGLIVFVPYVVDWLSVWCK